MIEFTMPVGRDQYQAAWREVPEADRVRVVNHLRHELPPELLADVRMRMEADPDNWAAPGHMGPGMFVRNTCRDVLHDEELPGVLYGWADTNNEPIRNWDDYYVQALEEAAAA